MEIGLSVSLVIGIVFVMNALDYSSLRRAFLCLKRKLFLHFQKSTIGIVDVMAFLAKKRNLIGSFNQSS